MRNVLDERDWLIDLWLTSEGEERTRILAQLVILDEQIEGEDVERRSEITRLHLLKNLF